MGNIYIETDENFRVTKIHRMPFDPNQGMGYTRDELEKKGYFVDEIPEPANQIGRRSIAMYNPDTKSIYYESVGIPMSDKERIDQLENAMNGMISTLYGMNMTMLSIDEGYSYPVIDSVGEYLAYQIISGKLEVDQCLKTFPQCEESIKTILMENGIQV